MNGKSGNGVISVGDTAYAVGLFWQTAEDAKSVRREAIEAAKQELTSPEFFVMREGNVAQWAIGWAGQGHRNKMPVGAACLADALAGNWIGIFKVDSRWWFVMARREAILPDGDVLFDDEDDCRIRFESEISRGGWDRIFAPANWGVAADSTPLEELLEGHVEPKLSHLQGMLSRMPLSAKIMIAAGVMAVLVAGYVGKTVLDSMAEKKRIEAEKERQAMLVQLEQERQQAELERQRLQNQKPVDLVDRVWEAKPLPEKLFAACADALRATTIELPGWTMTQMSCDQSGSIVNWVREEGSTVAAARYVLDPLNGSVSGDGNNAQLTKSFGNLEPRNSQKAWKLPDVNMRLTQMFQEMLLQATVTTEARVQLPPDEDPLHPRPRPPASVIIHYNSQLPPEAWLDIWSKFPGFVFETASIRIGAKEWEYQGRIYEELTDQELNSPEALQSYYELKAHPPAQPGVTQNATGGAS